MALIEVHADFKAVVKVLERIAAALDRAYPIRERRDGKPESELLSVSDEDLARIEDEEIRRAEQGLMDDGTEVG
jgi:hypothetical protein